MKTDKTSGRSYRQAARSDEAACKAANVTPFLPTTTISARQVRLWLVAAGVSLAAAIGLTEAQLDAAFDQAATI